MTLQQYITKREKEFDKKFVENKREDGEDYTLYLRDEDIKSFHRQTIKEVVKKILESVPADEKSRDDFGNNHGDGIRAKGYNQHVQEVKKWKKKLLKELK